MPAQPINHTIKITYMDGSSNIIKNVTYLALDYCTQPDDEGGGIYFNVRIDFDTYHASMSSTHYYVKAVEIVQDGDDK